MPASSLVRHYIGNAREDRREQPHARAEAGELPPAGYSERGVVKARAREKGITLRKPRQDACETIRARGYVD